MLVTLAKNLKKLSFDFNGSTFGMILPEDPAIETDVRDIFEGKSYPIHVSKEFPVSTIFDVGANVGAVSTYFHLAFPETKIYSFEPSPSTYWFLRKKILPGFRRFRPSTTDYLTKIKAHSFNKEILPACNHRSKREMKQRPA